MKSKHITFLKTRKNVPGWLTLAVFLLASPIILFAQSQMTLAPDYSKSECWLEDSHSKTKNSADIFYVYPTIIFGSKPCNMDIEDPELQKKAYTTMLGQAEIFINTADLYAPLYRQVSLPVLSLSQDESHQYFDVAYQDVKDAFLYYLNNFNNDRPFFLAGHSQGSEMILLLMKELFDDDSIRQRLIAAYAIGYSLTKDDLLEYPWLKMAQEESDLGVIISYNTQSPDASGSPILLPEAHCINPLNWTNTNEYAPKTLNQGAVFFDDDGIISNEILHYTDAQVRNDGALIVSTPNPDDFYDPGHSNFPRGVFHAHDYDFFFRNLQENVGLRLDTYLN